MPFSPKNPFYPVSNGPTWIPLFPAHQCLFFPALPILRIALIMPVILDPNRDAFQ